VERALEKDSVKFTDSIRMAT